MTSYTYNAFNEVLTAVDPTPNNYKTAFTFNVYGDQLTATDPLSHVTTTTYDENCQ